MTPIAPGPDGLGSPPALPEDSGPDRAERPDRWLPPTIAPGVWRGDPGLAPAAVPGGAPADPGPHRGPQPGPDAEPQLGPDPQQAPAQVVERAHPLTPLVRGWLFLLAMGGWFLKDMLPTASRPDQPLPVQAFDPLVVVAGLVALAVLVGLGGLVTWLTTRFVADPSELKVETGWLFRQSNRIAVLVGKPPADFRLAPAPLTPDAEVPVIPADLPSELLSRRPDIVAAERRVAAASARVGVSETERLPSLNLAGGVGVLKGLFGAVDLKAPLYRGGALDAGVARAAAEYDEAVANYRQAVLTGFQEVEDNLAAQRGLESAAASASAALATGAESERVARNQFRAGVGDYRAVVDGVDAAVQARADALDLQRRRLDASVALIKARGGGWQAGARGDATARAQ